MSDAKTSCRQPCKTIASRHPDVFEPAAATAMDSSGCESELAEALRTEAGIRRPRTKGCRPDVSGPEGGRISSAKAWKTAAPPNSSARNCWTTATRSIRLCTGTDVCQAITESRIQQRNAPVTVEEFHSLNQLLDNAIADAVSSYGFHRDRAVNGRAVHKTFTNGSGRWRSVSAVIRTVLKSIEAARRLARESCRPSTPGRDRRGRSCSTA